MMMACLSWTTRAVKPVTDAIISESVWKCAFGRLGNRSFAISQTAFQPWWRARHLRITQGGTRITHFSLATSRPKRDSNGKILRDDNNRRLEDTEWHRITDRKRTRLNSSH